MSQDQTGGLSGAHTGSLEAWWDGLSPDAQQGLLQLEEGEPVPVERAGTLTAGPDPILAEDENGAVHVDRRLATFLAERRENYGGYTV
jgi:hypothetical protein